MRIQRVYEFLLDGKTQRQIAEIEKVSEATISLDIDQIATDLGYHPRVVLIREKLFDKFDKCIEDMTDKNAIDLFRTIVPQIIKQEIKAMVKHVIQGVYMWEGDKPTLKEEKKDEPKTS